MLPVLTLTGKQKQVDDKAPNEKTVVVAVIHWKPKSPDPHLPPPSKSGDKTKKKQPVTNVCVSMQVYMCKETNKLNRKSGKGIKVS